MGFPCVLDTTGCEGWPSLSGHLLHVWGMLTSVSSVCRTVRCCWGVLRGCVPPGRCGKTCRQARLRVLGARPIEAGSDPRGHLGVTWGVYLCAGKPPLADIILSHPSELTRCDSVIGLAIPAVSGHIQYRGAAS